MPRVVPSQVVEFIDRVFPWLRTADSGNNVLGKVHAGAAAGLLDLVDRLIILSGREYTDLIFSVATIRDRLILWQNQQNPNIENSIGQTAGPLNPVTVIRQALSKCPDQNPSATTAEVKFIQDAELRENLRNDVAAIESGSGERRVESSYGPRRLHNRSIALVGSYEPPHGTSSGGSCCPRRE
jgi:hypothetical protein